MIDKTAPPPSRQRHDHDRLSAALRENLKRRKAQARGRADAAPPADDLQASPAAPDRKRDG